MPDIEVSLRLGMSFALLLLLALAEYRWPRHSAAPARARRWSSNLGMAVIDMLMLPGLVASWAVYAQSHDIGILHALQLPVVANWIVTIIVLDLLIYWQHRAMHMSPLLWRLHRVHHTDIALDTTSALRFHPFEILFSIGIKIAAVLALGAPPGAVLSFEILLNGFALFTHANLALPLAIDRVVRHVLVTPEMHRIHHSVLRDEHDSNFGFHLSIWDRLFRSYRSVSRDLPTMFELGLPVLRLPGDQTLPALLMQPFRSVE